MDKTSNLILGQHLGDFQAVIVDSTVRVLSQAEFLSEKRNAITVSWYGFDRHVQVGIGHGVLWCGGLMTGWLKEPVISLHL